jgi:hypothetical protein
MTNNKQQTAVDFVPYELALELKQLGFDEPCFAFYDESLYFPNNENQYGTFCNQKLDASSCSAPTYSQAFRWFRYKYWYTALILCDSFQIVMQLSTSKTLDSNTGEYSPVYITQTYHKEVGLKSYDESELACLKKLIEIVKGGNK